MHLLQIRCCDRSASEATCSIVQPSHPPCQPVVRRPEQVARPNLALPVCVWRPHKTPALALASTRAPGLLAGQLYPSPLKQGQGDYKLFLLVEAMYVRLPVLASPGPSGP